MLFSIEPSLIKTQSRLTVQNHSDHAQRQILLQFRRVSATGVASASTIQFSDSVILGVNLG